MNEKIMKSAERTLQTSVEHVMECLLGNHQCVDDPHHFLEKRSGGVHHNIIQLTEKTMIKKAFSDSGNNQKRAARMLGISVNTVRNKLQQYQLIKQD